VISAELAAVKPRVISPQSGDPIPLAGVIERIIAGGDHGAVCIHGGPGSGKSTALRHLAAVLPPGAAVRLLDTPVPRASLWPGDGSRWRVRAGIRSYGSFVNEPTEMNLTPLLPTIPHEFVIEKTARQTGATARGRLDEIIRDLCT
jgi:energy-coupling factor transporter ATP-binding protein EcfA2